jgi:hypothetical protein
MAPDKLNQIENLSIAKNANITRNLIDTISRLLQDKLEKIKSETDIGDVLGQLKWTIHETDLVRMLIIYETDCFVIVLINSKISLSETVDTILGYYYERD